MDSNAAAEAAQPADYAARAKAALPDIQQYLAQHGARLAEPHKSMFDNHMLALGRRLERGEQVTGLEDSFHEISPASFDIARTVVRMAYGVDPSLIEESEIFLIATHVEVAQLVKEE